MTSQTNAQTNSVEPREIPHAHTHTHTRTHKTETKQPCKISQYPMDSDPVKRTKRVSAKQQKAKAAKRFEAPPPETMKDLKKREERRVNRILGSGRVLSRIPQRVHTHYLNPYWGWKVRDCCQACGLRFSLWARLEFQAALNLNLKPPSEPNPTKATLNPKP